jgi:hypothetical protein
VHRLDVDLGEHERHPAGLVDTDPVLAGERSAGVDAGDEDRLGQLLRPLGLAWIAAVVEGGCRLPSPAWKTLPIGSPERVSSCLIRDNTSGSRVRGTTPSCT